MRPPMFVGPRSVQVPVEAAIASACAFARRNMCVVRSTPDASRAARKAPGCSDAPSTSPAADAVSEAPSRRVPSLRSDTLAASVSLRSEGTRSEGASDTASAAGEVEGASEQPGAFLAAREASGVDLTTHMFRRAKAQADAIAASTGTWTDLGPTNIGGRITDLVVASSQSNTIYVAAAGGGVWKSSDGGATFTTAWPDGNVQAIGALARGSNGTLWAGTGEANP